MAGMRGAKKRDERMCAAVEEAFFQKAVGSWVQHEEKVATEDDGKGGVKEKRESVNRQLPPDLDAIRAWLRERAPGRWRGEEVKSAGGGALIRVVTAAPRPGEA